MRWWSLPILAALGWFAFTLTPLWALHGLAQAVREGDTAYLERRINFRTLRLSMTRQIADAIRAAEAPEGTAARRGVAEAATAAALPLAEALVTPQRVIDLLDDGWPQGLDLPEARPGAGLGGLGLDRLDLERLLAVYAAADMRGFRSVVVSLPPGRPAAERFRIRLRLRDWAWRLVDIELTQDLRGRIAARVARAARGRSEPPTGEPAESAGAP